MVDGGGTLEGGEREEATGNGEDGPHLQVLAQVLELVDPRRRPRQLHLGDGGFREAAEIEGTLRDDAWWVDGEGIGGWDPLRGRRHFGAQQGGDGVLGREEGASDVEGAQRADSAE
jgi:hypothetical protein